MEKNSKSLRIIVMKCVKFFLVFGVLLGSCKQPLDEEYIDIDQMAMSEKEERSHIAGDSLDNPLEVMINDPLSHE